MRARKRTSYTGHLKSVCDVTECAVSDSGVGKLVSKKETERQRKERQKQRKLAELETTLQNALTALSQQGVRWENK